MKEERTLQTIADKTIRDFGTQWSVYAGNEGWYGSLEMFKDMIGPLLDIEELKGKDVADIGSGTGRTAMMLLHAGARHVAAIEPSTAYDALVENLKEFKDAASAVSALHIRGDQWVSDRPLDYVFSIGVIHHIPEPLPVLKAAYRSLKPGGKLFLWLYGREGNDQYLRVVEPLRAVTTRLPHGVLIALVAILYVAMMGYRFLAKFLALPLKDYIDKVLWPMSPNKRRLAIYDQLNPAYAKYYTQDDARALLGAAGFVDIRLHHRHGYSWSVIGTKPTAKRE
ncbi:MAG TPA: class I SAM-dependent methyltransferase [Candidatus Binatia bacterium]